jgi:hypothetical protein
MLLRYLSSTFLIFFEIYELFQWVLRKHIVHASPPTGGSAPAGAQFATGLKLAGDIPYKKSYRKGT